MQAAIRSTNDDAISCRRSCVDLGYFKDKIISKFSTPCRREPMINRGTFVRRFGIESVLNKFIQKHGPEAQIISLGAGYDTYFFNLTMPVGMYCEVDFEQITTNKIMRLQKNKLLPTGAKVVTGTDIYADHYMLIAGDLANFQHLLDKMLQSGLNIDRPTLVLSECVLIYLDSSSGNQIISSVVKTFKRSTFLTFEQILPDDRYGQVMIHNLAVICANKARKITLQSVNDYPTLESQSQRYTSLGFDICNSIDMNHVWDLVPQDEMHRVVKLEILDELEELTLIQAHYCLTFASNNDDAGVWLE